MSTRHIKMGIEQREAERHPTLSRARVFCKGQPDGFMAILKNVSDTGCMLVGSRIDYVGGVGTHFLMQADEFGKDVRFECEVRWRAKNQIGARFI